MLGIRYLRLGFGFQGPRRKAPVTKDPNEKTAVAEPQYTVQRKSRRAKIARPVRVRPSDPLEQHFEDLPISVNASKEGIYFMSRHKGYYKGMRVFVTFPYSSPHDPMNMEYVAEVVRIEELQNGKAGVAVHLKMSMNYSAAPKL